MTDQGGVVSHERLRAELPELAADVLDGRARAELLDHVDGCSSCALELEELTAAVDSLVHLAGEADPPVGFETRLFEEIRLRPSPARRRRPAWRRPFEAVGAAAAVAALVFGVSLAVTGGGGSSHPQMVRPTEHPARAPLVSDGRTVGVVFVYAGQQGWLSMRITGSSWNGPVKCTVTSTDGVVRTVGWFSLMSGDGGWLVPLPAGTNSVRAASLTDPAGTVVATARFTPPVTEA